MYPFKEVKVMEKYIQPELEVIKFSAEDVITTSGGNKIDEGGDGEF